MASERKTIEIDAIPELARITREARRRKQSVLLREDGRDVAMLVPIDAVPPPSRRRARRSRVMTLDDPLWEMLGSATDAASTDASSKHEYLADAYTPKEP